MEVRQQCLHLCHDPWEVALERLRDWCAETGYRVLADRPAWVIGCAIYEMHVGCAPSPNDATYEAYPTMQDLLLDLPRVADLGLGVLQIMPCCPFPDIPFMIIMTSLGSMARPRYSVGSSRQHIR